MPSSSHKGWFRRRKYGIGWALHKSWQGWLLILAYVALAAVGVERLEERTRAVSTYLLVLSALAILLCWWKGDHSLWRGDAIHPKIEPVDPDQRP